MNRGPLISVDMPARSDCTPTLEQYFSIGQEIACYINPVEAVL